MAKENKETKATDPRQEMWEAFLVKAREVNPVRFDADMEAGAFDKIPDSFIG